jgi:hypothetical protein
MALIIVLALTALASGGLVWLVRDSADSARHEQHEEELAAIRTELQGLHGALRVMQAAQRTRRQLRTELRRSDPYINYTDHEEYHS